MSAKNIKTLQLEIEKTKIILISPYTGKFTFIFFYQNMYCKVICKSYGTLNGVNTDLVISIIHTYTLHTTLFKMIDLFCLCITVIKMLPYNIIITTNFFITFNFQLWCFYNFQCLYFMVIIKTNNLLSIPEPLKQTPSAPNTQASTSRKN